MKKVWLITSILKRAPDAFRPTAGGLVSGFINLEVRSCSILRPTTKNLLERSVTTQITHYNYQTWQLGHRPRMEWPLWHLHFQHSPSTAELSASLSMNFGNLDPRLPWHRGSFLESSWRCSGALWSSNSCAPLGLTILRDLVLVKSCGIALPRNSPCVRTFRATHNT